MPESIPCAELADALAEVATGAAAGPVRALVLAHVMSCDNCRNELDALSRAADEVLLIAPEHEPPAGFESAVLARIAAEVAPSRPLPHPGSVTPIRPRRWVRPVLMAASAAVIGLAGTGIVWRTTESDRELAAAYDRTLDVANGQYFSAAPLLDTAGEQIGHVFLYQGEPSWVFAVLDDSPHPNSFEVIATTPAGDVTVAQCVATDGGCGAGGTVDVDISEISQVTLVSPVDGTAATATLSGRWPDWAS